MSLFNEKVQNQVREILKQMDNPVSIVFFTQEFECGSCGDARIFAGEFSALSDKIKLNTYDFVLDREKAEKYQVDKIPAMVLLDNANTDTGIKFYGIPGGYEINSFIGSILEVSGHRSDLPPDIAKRIAAVGKDVHIQVFVSLACPYCPGAVGTAHRLAVENKKIRADMVDTALFPHLVQKYAVMAVPKIVINEKDSMEGAVPITEFLAMIEKM